MLNMGTIFLFIVFYLACTVGVLSSKRRFYKKMWTVASIVLGSACVASAFLIVAGVLGVIAAI